MTDGPGDERASVTDKVAERLDRFMARANAIYYATHDPFADFTTSPEISQVFGEIIGLWAAVAWRLLGRPNPVSLVEAGPGRGTLIADALRAAAQAAPDFARALTVHLIETSPRLRAAQRGRVPGAVWHDDLAGVPEQPMILVANEFLDALPIRQFVRRDDGWTERFVSAGAWVEQPVARAEAVRDEVAGGDSIPEEAASAQGALCGAAFGRAVAGDVVEVNEPARAFVAGLARRFRRQAGTALVLDYGPARSGVGDSLQAIAGKRPVNPLSPAGSADLTAHVDFSDLSGIARALGGCVQGPVAQGRFLADLGLFQRTEHLMQGQPADRASALLGAARRLAEPAAMGRLFKVMAVCSPGCPTLPGFEDAGSENARSRTARSGDAASAEGGPEAGGSP